MEKVMTEEAEEAPDRRKHGYKDLEDKLDNHAARLDKRLETFIRQALIAFAIIGITSVGSLVGFGILLSKQGQTASEIQAQRRESIFRSCYEQNLRHDNTITQLQIISDVNVKRHPERATEIKESVRPTITLIDALAPKQNCVKLVKESVDGG